jgi:peptidoglycan/LPS O-acetylase OafA/YrhL
MFKRLLHLNGFAILGVIIFHASGWGFVSMFAWAERYAPYVQPGFQPGTTVSYFALRTMEQLAVFSIPAFLFVSGLFIAFAAGRQAQTISWTIVTARIRKLLVPYLLWSILLLVLLVAEGRMPSPQFFAIALLTGQANPAYYYVPLLIQFYALSPYLVPLARKHARLLIAVTALIQLAVQATYYPGLLGIDIPLLQTAAHFLPKWLFVTRIFWFSAGIVAGFNLKTLEERLPRWRWPLLGATIVLLVLGVLEWLSISNASGEMWIEHRETYVDTLYSIAVILTVLAFFQHKIPFDNIMGDLGARSYGIYLVHSPAMEYGLRTIYHLAPQLLAYQIVLQPFLIIVGLGAPLLLMYAANNTVARRFYKYGFG